MPTLQHFPLTSGAWPAVTPDLKAIISAQCAAVASYTPYWDAAVSWAPAFAYRDAYAIYGTGGVIDPARNPPIVVAHPEWILRDAAGNPCYIPFKNAQGAVDQMAADIGNPEWIEYFVSRSAEDAANGYAGTFVDDVNLDISRVGDANANPAKPIDPRTGQPMTPLAWKAYFVAFLQELRKATQALGIKLIHNAVWFFGSGPGDLLINAQIQACDYVWFENAFGDQGLTGGTGQFSLGAKIGQIQRVYGLGATPVAGEYQYANAAYKVACMRMADPLNPAVTLGGIGFADLGPGQWDATFERLVHADLGDALGPAERISGVWQRLYQHGAVYLVEPGGDTAHLLLDYAMTDCATGQVVVAVDLAASRGVVLHK